MTLSYLAYCENVDPTFLELMFMTPLDVLLCLPEIATFSVIRKTESVTPRPGLARPPWVS